METKTETRSIKETKEMLAAVLDCVCILMKLLIDGAQLRDVAELWDLIQINGEFRTKLTDAYEGSRQIPAELRDLDLTESLVLAQMVLVKLPDILAAMKTNEVLPAS